MLIETRKTSAQWLTQSGPVAGLLFVCIVFGLLVGPQFFRAGNLELIARQTAIVAVAALGMTIVIASGGIDLSVGSVVSLSTITIALTLRSGMHPLGAALAGVAAGAVCGLCSGLLVTRL